MTRLWQSVPDAEILIAMEPEELGRHLLAHIRTNDRAQAHLSEFEGTLFPGSDRDHYPRRYHDQVMRAVLEAWTWLQSEVMLVPTHGTSNGWCRLSRRAEELDQPELFKEYLAARLLPKEILHPSIRDRVWLNVMRGDYDLAVFEAMRAVEIEVRDASGINELGVKLMRQAFHPETGPLTDRNAEAGERQARLDLFAGAIGSYKHPVSHKHVPLVEAAEVIEQILLASHLLRIVDERKAIVGEGLNRVGVSQKVR
jgi:uncharacterized protein (TIGR02391 family)